MHPYFDPNFLTERQNPTTMRQGDVGQRRSKPSEQWKVGVSV